MPIEGSLKELSLSSLIQLNCTEMNTATVSLRYQGKDGTICFQEGAIVHAEVGDLVGDEAVYALLTWPDGSFVVEREAIPAERTITSNWNRLLLEGMRRLDEARAIPEEPAEEYSPTEPAASAGDAGLIAQSLNKVAGVEGAVIISRDGVVLASDMESDAKKEGAVAVFVGNAANQAAEALSLGPFDWGVVTMGRDRILIVEAPSFFAGMLLTESASPALVGAEAGQILE